MTWERFMVVYFVAFGIFSIVMPLWVIYRPMSPEELKALTEEGKPV